MKLPRLLRLLAASLLLLAAAACGSMPAGKQGHAYMVASASSYASDAGASILAKGGSAVDAAIAVQAVLTLTEPDSSGLAGGAFMLHWAHSSQKLDAYDGRETAPAGATPDMFLSEKGEPLSFPDAWVSGRSVGTPGVVAMLWLAHQQHGILPWSMLFEPAIKLARDGFVVSPKFAATIAADPKLASIPVTQDYFFPRNAAGERVPAAAGTLLKNPALAGTLEIIAREGADGFYKGQVAEGIINAVRHAPNRPGTLSLSDLSSYQAKQRDAICRTYRIYKICTMPPPTSGGIATLQILGILETFDMPHMTAMSPESIHLIAEAEKLAYADRSKYLGDPDAVHVPINAMLDGDYLRRRASLIDLQHSMKLAAPGQIDDRRAAGYGENADISFPSTTHFSIMDAKGNAVSMTSSIEAPFGSHLMSGGMMLNNQLTDFSFLPVRDGKPVANAVAPGKRPLSSMDPAIIFDAKGDVYASIGSPGGPRIIGYVTQTIVSLLDWHMDMQEAISSPRFIDRNGDLEIEKDTSLSSMVPALSALGHNVKEVGLKSGLHGIRVTPTGLEGGADPRREGTVVSASN